MKKNDKQNFDLLAQNKKFWKNRDNYYNRELRRSYSYIVPEDSIILELGCAGGDLLNSLKPARGVGIDISTNMLQYARKRNPELEYIEGDVEQISEPNETFEYVIGADLVGHLDDIYGFLNNIKRFCNSDTRVIFSFYNNIWLPIVKMGEILGLKSKTRIQHWVSINDMDNLLRICGYKLINKDKFMLIPVYIPLIGYFINRFIAPLPLIKNFCLVQSVIARKITGEKKDYTCSIIVPSVNEKGNIEELVNRMPKFGSDMEIIFVDGGSTDGTIEEIERMITEHPEKDISLIHQGGFLGKNDAVRKGFIKSKGEILFIEDSDITVDPETLTEFYEIISSGRGEFINGSRLVYALDQKAMRFLNILGNMVFSAIFTYLLNQKIKDTLCGTKVIFKRHWEEVNKSREYFGDFDPFGDFELLFGAAKLNLDIVELPVKYRARKYGDIKIQRFRHGLMLLKMAFIGFIKLKVNT
ncbi:MAG: bifunctional class I SAM-dependent methyltransferase/glycosyltransferase family 2 protein [Elusimicrobiota bacterium]